jgi:monoamine oxidase
VIRPYDVVIVGGGFAGVTAASRAALRGRSVLLLEARNRLGGRTWNARWSETPIEYGGAWVHWHQPHTWSEITRAGLSVELSPDAEVAAWYVGSERLVGTIAERDEVARRGWDRFVDGVTEALPNPHDPLAARDRLVPFDRLTIAERVADLDLSSEERAVLEAELESLAHAPLQDAGAVSVLRWHALSGYSLSLTQYAGGRVTIAGGTGTLLRAISEEAPFERRLDSPVDNVEAHAHGVAVRTRDGSVFNARRAVIAVPLNALDAISFTPELSERKREAIALGQASRGIKIFIRARGEPVSQNAISPGHPFGYLDTEVLDGDSTQLMIGFGRDAEQCDASDLSRVQQQLDAIMPGYEALDATAHDWLADEFSRGTWAIHRPGWYEHFHAEVQRPEGPVLLAGSDFANGWAGFIDGAIESGLRAGRWAARVAD